MSREMACPQCAAGVCSAHQPEQTPADLAAAYPWALRVVRYDDHGRPPGTEAAEPFWLPPRSAWGDGAWMTEPDLVEWRTAVAPYPLIILRGGMGQLNGYVGVPPGHPLHGKRSFPGVNWAGPCGGLRVPTGEPPVCWWLGFDCGRGSEYCPLMSAGLDWMVEFTKEVTGVECQPFARRPETYLPVDECRIRTEALAMVLKAVDTPDALAHAFESLGITAG